MSSKQLDMFAPQAKPSGLTGGVAPGMGGHASVTRDNTVTAFERLVGRPPRAGEQKVVRVAGQCRCGTMLMGSEEMEMGACRTCVPR
jgi:hypothetical protein